MRRAGGSRHRGGKLKTLLGNLQIGRLDFVADAVSAGRYRRKISGACSDEWVENCVAGKRKEFNQALGKACLLYTSPSPRD